MAAVCFEFVFNDEKATNMQGILVTLFCKMKQPLGYYAWMEGLVEKMDL